MNPAPSIASAPGGEPVTLLFSDIEGSTRLVQSLDQAYDGTLAQHFRILRKTVSEHQGREVAAHSDAFFATFDSPDSAVASAVAIQRRMAAAEWPASAAVKVRLGLHTGHPRRTADRHIGYVGIDVHRAARIADAAHGGQILMSGATYSLLGEHAVPADAAVRYLGTYRLKDLHYPENLYEVALRPGEAFPPIRSVDTHGTNLPSLSSSFIGREAEIARLQSLLRQGDVRLVTLTGPGGAGKTRLSIEATAGLIDAFPDGVLQVLLGGIAEPRLVAPAIAQALGIPEFPGHSVMDGLKHAIGAKRMLLVVDNFEQVIEAAPVLAELLGACRRLKALVTSREALRISGEVEFSLAPFALPAAASPAAAEELFSNHAVMLFADRARQANPRFALTAETAPLAAEICRRLDGLPLAIELAASRMKVLGMPGLLDRLRTGLHSLGRGPRDAEKRHSTLRDAIAWSYDLLNESEKDAFRQLSVFVDGFDIPSAERVCHGVDVLDAVESLRDKSLLSATTAEGEPRFRMLETIREFGLERLAAAGADREVRERHAAYFTALAENLAPGLVTREQRRVVSRLVVDADNIRAALAWAIEESRTDILGRLVKALLWFWIPQSRFTEGHAWLEHAVRVVTTADSDRDRAVVLDASGWLKMIAGDYAGALPLFEKAFDLYRAVGSDEDVIRTTMTLGITAAVAKGDREGVTKIGEALARYQESGNAHGAGLALIALGEGARAGGDMQTAAGCYGAALNAMRSAGDMYWTAAVLLNTAQLRLQAGDWQAASPLLGEALAVAQEYNYPMVMNLYVAVMGGLALAQGEPVKAAELFGATDALLAAVGATFEPADQAMLADRVAAAKAQLGEERFGAAYAAGRTWTRDEAIRSAMAIGAQSG